MSNCQSLSKTAKYNFLMCNVSRQSDTVNANTVKDICEHLEKDRGYLTIKCPPQMMEGSITVESELDVGTTVYVKIPKVSKSAQKPEFLIVGEAAGYRGCGRTGIPFTDEATLTWLSDNVSDFFKCRIISKPPTKEQSAQVIWEVLKQNDSNGMPKFNRVVMWNAFPFHPFEAGNPPHL